MNYLKKTGKIVGALFLVVMVAYSIGAFVLIDPILNDPDHLLKISANKTKVVIGVLLELINGIAYIGIAVLVYPFIKQLSESMALGYVCFRIIEFVMQIISSMSPLLLSSLSQEIETTGTTDISSFQDLSTLLLGLRYWANQMVFITYALGALIFYYSFYRSKLIPRILTVWGLIGAPLVLINTLLDVFDIGQIIILGLVMGLNEIVMGIWLLVKGFNDSAMASEHT